MKNKLIKFILSFTDYDKVKKEIKQPLHPAYSDEWIAKMELIDEILEMYHINDIKVLKNILERK